MKRIDVRLRREYIPNGVEGRKSNFWLLYDARTNQDREIEDSLVVRSLDNIYNKNDNQAVRNEKIAEYLCLTGFVNEKLNVRAFWLPPVENALSAPVKIFFNPSGKCPNRCLTCFADVLGSATLKDKVAREAFDQLVNLPVFWMNLGGCELSFYHLYFEFAAKSIENGIHTSTAISGVGLTKDWAKNAKALGVKVKVSLDGPERINDIQRPGTFEPAISAIRLFRSIGYPIRINMVHTRLNNDEKIIDEMFEIAHKYGAAGIDISICRPKGGATTNDLMIPIEEYQNGKVRSVIDSFLNHPYIKSHGIKAWINKNARTLDYLNAKPCQALNIHCNAGRYSMGVNNDGSIDACIFLPNEYIPLANINTPELFCNSDFILNIWQTDSIFKKVRDYTKGILCQNCQQKGIAFIRGCKACAAYYHGIDPMVLLH
jgi:MoaA/NifB/PqqE/SkfB family radical SAM enzyme